MIRTPGIVKEGEVITLGWNYYESRANILNVLVDFNAKQDIDEVYLQVMKENPKEELEDFYKRMIGRWVALGYVKEAITVHEFKGSIIRLPVEDINTSNWELIVNGETYD